MCKNTYFILKIIFINQLLFYQFSFLSFGCQICYMYNACRFVRFLSEYSGTSNKLTWPPLYNVLTPQSPRPLLFEPTDTFTDLFWPPTYKGKFLRLQFRHIKFCDRDQQGDLIIQSKSSLKPTANR